MLHHRPYRFVPAALFEKFSGRNQPDALSFESKARCVQGADARQIAMSRLCV